MFPTDTLFVASYICKFILCQKEALRARERGFPGNRCTQSSAPLTNAALSDITCKMKLKWHPTFSGDCWFPSEIQSYKNTRTGFRFWNVLCSCLFNKVKAFWKIYLWPSVLILWRSARNKSVYGKHWNVTKNNTVFNIYLYYTLFFKCLAYIFFTFLLYVF